MSEKRFSRKSVEDLIVEKGLDSIVDLLNELSEENKQLRKRVKELEKLISDVEKSEGMSIENLIDDEMI